MTERVHRVLVADDDPTMRLLMPVALAGKGFALSVFEDGLAARDALQQAAFDLVVLDVEMPGMDGLALAGLMRQMPAYAGVPLVLLTGRQDAAFLAACVELGAHHLAKPIDWQEIAGIFSELLRAGARGGMMPADQADA